MLAPAPDAAVLLPAHLDALCQTSPQPAPSPDVSFFIHGPQRDNMQVNVCWRADIRLDDESADTYWPQVARLLPPTSIECMSVSLRLLRDWMRDSNAKDQLDADVPAITEAEEKQRAASEKPSLKRVVVWRGASDVEVVGDPNKLRPNDTIIMPEEYRNWNLLGHIPEPKPADYDRPARESDPDHDIRCQKLDRKVDVAEEATRLAKLRVVVRVHRAFEGTHSLRGLSDEELRRALIARGEIPEAWNRNPVARLERHLYRDEATEDPNKHPDEVIVFKRLLVPQGRLVLRRDEEDDGHDGLSERDQIVSLAAHTKHVVEYTQRVLGKLRLGEAESAVCKAAELHDIGKADVRFQAMLAGITPYEAMMRPTVLGKGDGVRRSQAERQAICDRAKYPSGFRHEMLSVELIEHLQLQSNLADRQLMLHLVAAHHGYARPFAPVCIDPASDELLAVEFDGQMIPGDARKKWVPSHRLDSGVPERFWELTRRHGWWGLAWLESILRLADQQASSDEQEGKVR